MFGAKMSDFAIIKTGGKQLRVAKGKHIYVEKLAIEPGKSVIFEEVLMVDDKVGEPLLKSAKVKGKVVKHGRQRKIIIFKYRPKKDSHSKQGHRQNYTEVEIEAISLTGKFAAPKKAVPVKAKKSSTAKTSTTAKTSVVKNKATSASTTANVNKTASSGVVKATAKKATTTKKPTTTPKTTTTKKATTTKKPTTTPKTTTTKKATAIKKPTAAKKTTTTKKPAQAPSKTAKPVAKVKNKK